MIFVDANIWISFANKKDRDHQKAITLMNEAEEYHIKKIEELIREPIPRKKLPSGVKIEGTPFEEKQVMAKEIDNQRRKEDPTYLGAFHEKKERKQATFKKSAKNRRKK